MTWSELPDLTLVLATVAIIVIGVWATVAPASWAAAWVTRAARFTGGPVRLGLVLISAIVFLAVAEDVLWPEETEWVTQLDRHVETAGAALGKVPLIHLLARWVSLGTGAGLVGAVLVAAGLLAWTRRIRSAGVLLVGTAGGWIVYTLLKLSFRIPRPSARLLDDERGYGFPSGHTVTTLVAVGLLVWLCSSGLSRSRRLALYAAALLIVGVTGASRILLHAHRFSDVLAGMAIGVAYLALATGWSAARWPAPPVSVADAVAGTSPAPGPAEIS